MKASNTIKFYNTISPLYWLINIFIEKGKRLLFRNINHINKSKVLIKGIGTASQVEQLQKHSVFGIDFSENMLQKAKDRKLENVNLSLQNAEQTNFENEFFDIIILSHILSVAENPEKLIKESYRVLKPNGKLFILNHNSVGILKYFDILFTPVARLFQYSSYFCIEKIKGLCRFKKVNQKSVFLNNYITIIEYQK